jgi:Kef-type K+ transport system membrane component KefB
VLHELGVLRSDEARIILGAAVIDDVLGLILLAVVTSAAQATASPLAIALVSLQAMAFVVFVGWAGSHVTRRYSARLDVVRRHLGLLSVGLIAMLGLAALAGVIGLAGIIGAFLAGMVLAESREREELAETVRPVYEFLVPFFFVVTGTRVTLSALGEPGTLALAAVISAIAVAGKLIGAGAATWGLPLPKVLVVGVGMVPRGEVGLIVAGIGHSAGIIPDNVFAVVVVMSVVTTLIVPPALALIYRRWPAPGAASAVTREPLDALPVEEEAAL